MRTWLAYGAAALALVAGVVTGPAWSYANTLPAAGTTAILLLFLLAGRPLRRLLPAGAAAAGAISLSGTLWSRAMLVSESSTALGISIAVLFDLTALIWLIILVVRHAPVRLVWLGCSLAVPAQLATFFRGFHTEESPIGALAGLGFFSVGSIAAVLGGLYLRGLDTSRAQAVRAAQQAQRMDLARDLHDYVAHDISGIVVQAQAAQVVAGQDAAAALDSLRRIERAGQQALTTMDRTVRMLRDPDAPEPTLGIDDLTALVERFGEGGSTDATLWMDPGLAAGLPHEVSSTLYRVAVEGLTNVRRHAPAASAVTVSVDATPEEAVLTVRNEPPADPRGVVTAEASETGTRHQARAARPGGLGLAGLRERVVALGGELNARPADGGGWTLTARIPLRTEFQDT